MIKLPPIRILAPVRETGDLFSRRVSELFRLLGYDHPTLNVHKAGREIDIVARHRTEPRWLVAECKATAKPIGGNEINKFAGALQVEQQRKQENVTGYFLSLAGFTPTALEQEQDYGEPPRLILLDGQRIVEELVRGGIVTSPEEAIGIVKSHAEAADLIPEDRPQLLIHELGWIWAVRLRRNVEPTHVAFVHEDGELLSPNYARGVQSADREAQGNLHRLIPLSPGRRHPEDAELASTPAPGEGEERDLLHIYLDQVVRANSLIALPTGSGETERLDRVFVPMAVRIEPRPGLAREEKDGPLAALSGLRELLDLDTLAYPRVTRRWILRGDPGAGKTTLLRHLAVTVAREPEPRWIPVLEPCSRLIKPEFFLDRLARDLEQAGHSARGLRSSLERAGREGRLLLLFDGLDEVPHDKREEVERLLQDWSAQWPAAPIVVSTRPIGYRRPGSDFAEVDLLPLDQQRRLELLARWFGRAEGSADTQRAARELDAIEEDWGLRELAGNPLYLTLMALLLEKDTQPARNRADLYKQVFKLLLDSRHRAVEDPMELQSAIMDLLQFLAYSMTRDNRDAEPLDALERRLYEPAAHGLRLPFEQAPRWGDLRRFLWDLARRTGILGPRGKSDTDWQFWHRTFREALAAERLDAIARKEGFEAVLTHARSISGDEGRWAEPYALLAGLSEDPDGLVAALMQANPALGLRALATAPGLRDETLSEVLALSRDWRERASVYRRLPDLVDDDPRRALALLDRLRRRTRDGNDLFFLDLAARTVAQRWPEQTSACDELCERLFDHIPCSPENLFQWIETPLAGRTELWRKIPTGPFLMGSADGDGLRWERPRHRVTLLSPFALAAVPVTNALYAAFDPGHEPQAWGRVPADELPFHPVVHVSWYAAVSFCRWLSASLSWARGARLPTEEEWEYACRAGTVSLYWSGDAKADLDRVGWYSDNAQGRTHRVGEKPPNDWGLFDVHGNVWEWTASQPSRSYADREDGLTVDPRTFREEPELENPDERRRVVRGGGYWATARRVRAASRDHGHPAFESKGIGFRVCLPLLSVR